MLLLFEGFSGMLHCARGVPPSAWLTAGAMYLIYPGFPRRHPALTNRSIRMILFRIFVLLGIDFTPRSAQLPAGVKSTHSALCRAASSRPQPAT
jgi:hypothetical protein